MLAWNGRLALLCWLAPCRFGWYVLCFTTIITTIPTITLTNMIITRGTHAVLWAVHAVLCCALCTCAVRAVPCVLCCVCVCMLCCVCSNSRACGDSCTHIRILKWTSNILDIVIGVLSFSMNMTITHSVCAIVPMNTYVANPQQKKLVCRANSCCACCVFQQSERTS